MGLTKHELYPKEHNDLANLIKAIGHPARLSILQYLTHHVMASEKEIAAHVGLSQPSISRHLNLLIQREMVESRYFGKVIGYSLVTPKFRQARRRMQKEIFEKMLD